MKFLLVEGIIESGSDVSTISSKWFKAHNFKAKLKPRQRAIYAYSSKKAIQICGDFNAQVSGKKNIHREIRNGTTTTPE